MLGIKYRKLKTVVGILDFKIKLLQVFIVGLVSEIQAVRELQQVITDNREQEVDLGHLDYLPQSSKPNVSSVPLVHPKIFEVKQFFQNRNPTNLQQRGQEVQFDDLLSSDNRIRFACLIGPPGVGKTTLSKRLANSSVYELSLRLTFASINYAEKLTLQELLIKNQFANFGFSVEKCQKVFSWMLNNQSKCLLVIDGLDQAQFEIDEQPPKEWCDSRLNVGTIIACLFKKIFLPNVRIIVTSRPHAVLDLHYSQRPDAVYQLEGLSDENTNKLLQFLSGDRYEEFSSNLKKMGPELESLCSCPLLLQMFVLSQLDPSETIGEAKTITRMFATVLKNLQLSKHIQTDFQEIRTKLARLAFNTFKNNQMLITWKQVSDEGLTQEEIQDLIVTVPGRNKMAFKVLDTNKLLYFSHQMIHEYYCALHLWESLPCEDFRQFLKESKGKKQFIIVKKFLYGLAYDIDCNQGEILFIFC